MFREPPIALIFAVVIAVVIGVMVVGGAVDIEEAREFHDRAEAWCDAEDGMLFSEGMGAHGGLHCGMGHEMVHMADVAALNWTHDIDAAQRHFRQRTGPLGMFNVGFVGIAVGAAAVFAVIGAAVIGWYHRRRGENVG